MIKTPKARNFVRRWVDSTIFVDGTTTTSHRVTNRTANNVSLYEFILAYLSRESMCDNYTGSIISDSEVYIPASAFLTSATSSRTNNRNIDLYAAINTVVADGDICDLPFSINADTYTVDFLKTLYLDLRLDSTEISKPFLARPQNIRRKNPNDAISMKTLIDNYAKDILGIDSLPTATITLDYLDPNQVTVTMTGLKSDGVTPMGAGDKFYMWATFNGFTYAFNSGNAIEWGDAFTISGPYPSDWQILGNFLAASSIEDIGGGNVGLADAFQFSKNVGGYAEYIHPITFTYRVYEDFGLPTEKFSYRISDTVPVLAGGTR
jgi:hypothetical protein